MTFEEKGATLVATDSETGKQIWQSRFADSVPDRQAEDQWTLAESKDGKAVTLTWARNLAPRGTRSTWLPAK